MRRRTAILGFLALVFLAAIYSVYWWIVAARFPALVDDWAAERRAAGWRVDYRIGRVEGFPLTLRSEISGASLAGPGIPAPWTWQGAPITVRARPWHIATVAFEFAGRHRGVVTTKEAPLEIDATVAAARGSAEFGAGPWPKVELEMGGVAVTTSAQPTPTRVATLRASLAPQPAPNRPQGEDATSPRLAVSALDADLPDQPSPIFGTRVERFDLDAVFVGRLPRGPLGPALTAWRDDGGTIEVQRLRLKWGPLDAEGSGTIALDAERRPLAASNVRVQGYGRAIDELARTGAVRGRDAVAARLMLGLLGRTGRTGRDEVTVSLTVQDGWLSAGPARLLRVPPLPLE